MSLEHFVDGLMSEYTGFGEDPKYASIPDPDLRKSEGEMYDLGQTLGIVSKLGLGGLGLYSLYTAGIAAGLAVAGTLAIAACLKWVFVDPIFIKQGKKPITLGGVVKKAVDGIKLNRIKRQVFELYNEHGPVSREEAMAAARRAVELDDTLGIGLGEEYIVYPE